MKKFASIFLGIAFSVLLNAQEKQALILIDIQEFYFPGGFSELENPDSAAHKAAQVLSHFRDEDLTVVHIQHKTDKQMEINKAVLPIDSEAIFVKVEVNAFNGSELKDYLDSLRITKLVIVGMQTHMCVEAATRAAYDFGYEVTLIEDACATKNLMWKEKEVLAKDVHASTLNTLQNYATVVTLDEFFNTLKK